MRLIRTAALALAILAAAAIPARPQGSPLGTRSQFAAVNQMPYADSFPDNGGLFQPYGVDVQQIQHAIADCPVSGCAVVIPAHMTGAAGDWAGGAVNCSTNPAITDYRGGLVTWGVKATSGNNCIVAYQLNGGGGASGITGAVTAGIIPMGTGTSTIGNSSPQLDTITTPGTLTFAGPITGTGTVTGSSLSAGSGTITGGSLSASGAVTGASLSAGSGAITGGSATLSGAGGLNITTGGLTCPNCSDYRLTRVFMITANQTYTHPANVRALYVECIGGGGGGGSANITSSNSSAAGGGAAGSYAASFLTSLAASYTVTIGTGGGGGSAGGAGGTGTDTTFGSVITAKGGGGGSAGTASGTGVVASPGGTPQAGNVGDLTIAGGGGNWGIVVSASLAGAGGGGSSQFGSGNNGNIWVTASVGIAAGRLGGTFGGGGPGAANVGTQGTAQVGSAGAPGVVRVWEFD